MIAPHYVGENKLDLRGIKPGWYAMNSKGNLLSGPFSSQEKCAEKISNPSHVRPPTAQKQRLYSITSSAVAISVGGTARPSILAVC